MFLYIIRSYISIVPWKQLPCQLGEIFNPFFTVIPRNEYVFVPPKWPVYMQLNADVIGPPPLSIKPKTPLTVYSQPTIPFKLHTIALIKSSVCSLGSFSVYTTSALTPISSRRLIIVCASLNLSASNHSITRLVK